MRRDDALLTISDFLTSNRGPKIFRTFNTPVTRQNLKTPIFI